ncbi:MAG: hypothetical protein M0035_13900, partial [Actinomycetota bacterium]|nr:hypothetical protein [Actinomycetota bacterium]
MTAGAPADAHPGEALSRVVSLPLGAVLIAAALVGFSRAASAATASSVTIPIKQHTATSLAAQAASTGQILYAVNPGNNSVTGYAPGATGDTAPGVTISGSAT